MRIRHQGFLANRCRKERIELCRELLDAAQPAASPASDHDVAHDVSAPRCPVCKKGQLVCTRTLSAGQLAHISSVNADDTS